MAAQDGDQRAGPADRGDDATGANRLIRRAGLCLVLLLLAASCGWRSSEPLPATVWPVDPATCFAALEREPVTFVPWVDAPTAAVCAVPAPVVVQASRATMTPVLQTSCPMILAWARFEPELHELALRRFGSPIAQIHHYGSYNCRRMSGNQRRMSLHSTGRALDLAGFTLVDGRYIGVQQGWRGGRDERAFLRDLSQAACRHFNVVLTPNHDRAHANHIHVDIGPWRLCRA